LSAIDRFRQGAGCSFAWHVRREGPCRRTELAKRVVILGAALGLLGFLPGLRASTSGNTTQALESESSNPREDLRLGIDLTRQGRFQEAIPHFLAARGRVDDEYAADFNLALCYVATRQPKLAIPILKDLQSQGKNSAEVWNLLSQAYIGDSQTENGFEAFERAAVLTPTSEKLYVFIADACMDQQAYGLGLRVVDVGLKNLPESARLRYERGVFLTGLDRFDEAKPDFDFASRVGAGTDIGYLAAAHKDLIEWDTAGAIHVVREAIANGKSNYILLSILGEALIRSGATPGQPTLKDAEDALEKSVALRADYSQSRISLGKLYLMEGRADDAVAQLERARELAPKNPAVYSYLAAAYRRKGDVAHAREMLATLARLNQEQVTAIRDSGTATGVRRGAVNGVQDQ